MSSGARWRRGLGGAALTLAAARALPAQAPACAVRQDDTTAAERRWPPPLDRTVTLRATDLSLRDALERVAAQARIRVSYSPELLPLGRRVCAELDSVPAGHVLARLLSGTDAMPVTAGGDQVVLAPRPRNTVHAETPTVARSVGMLDRVVVTGSATGLPARESTIGVDVLSGRSLERDNTGTVAGALDAYVPGVWSWTQSPSNLLSSYASIRGASSFGLSYPKIYIDGIEVANPLLLSHFNATSIDHIEVIRGPQGSALYGADAISGVINIITRHQGTNDDGTHAQLRSVAGVSQSAFSRGVLAQEHTLALVSGSSTRSADLHVQAGSMGAFVPNGYSRQLMANGAARAVGARGTLSGTARLYVEQAGAPSSPLMFSQLASVADTLQGSATGATKSPQSVVEYTLGTTATVVGNERWTHAFVAGIDGYRLANVQTSYAPVPTPVDSALRAAQGGADRATIRATSTMRLRANDPTRATLTFSAEHSALRALSPMVARTNADIGPDAMFEPEGQGAIWQNSTGLSSQLSVALRDALYATGGVRVERDSRLSANARVALLPMLGLATVRDYGPLNVKVRAAYGKGIRPPSTLSRWQVLRPGELITRSPLGPEEQSGTELGLDLSLRRALTLQLTRFDQRASGLIQQVAVAANSESGGRRLVYAAENVGEISNAGWEIQSTGAWSNLSVTGAMAFVDSRVRKRAAEYTGDLLTGDRMLQVPARTASLNVAWRALDWSAALTGSRAMDWINYDQLGLAQAWVSNSYPLRDLLGPRRLRQYWHRYDGGLHLGATASRDLRPDLSLEITADNLLNYQRGEPDNITIVPGRTIMTGVRIKF
ncbi:MAG TPA: TonB-dependent receptor [Gemmatimonadaceae bacterium]|jgi:iron complex outermembrane receptor protein|nr:TonB-dependent receptor [Gemmatimonadaceae bacterium]